MGIDGSGQRVAIIGRSDMNQSYIANATELSIPAALKDLVSGVRGLDDFWKADLPHYANNFNDAAQGAIDQNLAPVMSESYGTCEIGPAVGLRALAQQAHAQGITWLASSRDSGGAGCDPHGFFNSTVGLVPAPLQPPQRS